MFRQSVLIATAAALAACSTKPVAVAVAPPPPPPAPVAAPMPAGGFPGMVIPARLPDGRWPTPTYDLTADAATWHLRAALNVAALTCRGPNDAGVVPAYNALLTGRRAALAATEARYAAEWHAGGAKDWRDRYDDTMTRVYNFYGQSFARDGFCAAAGQVLTELATVSDADLATVVPRQLAMLDQPFTTFFAAYDAWRGDTQPVFATVAPVAVAPPIQVAQKPVLTVNPAVFQLP